MATNDKDTQQQTMDKYNGLQPGEQHVPPLPAFLTYQAGATFPLVMWQITDKQLWYVLTPYVQEYEETSVMDDDSDMLIDLYLMQVASRKSATTPLVQNKEMT